MDITRETDPEQLRLIALTLQKQVEVLLRALSDKCDELQRVTGREDELQRTLALIEELQRKADEQERKQKQALADKPSRKPQKGHGPTPQLELPRVEVVIELDEADKTCPSCGGELKAWDGQYEDSELIDVLDVRYQLVHQRRQKYRCACGGCVETAEGGTERAVRGGRYSLAFGVKVAVDKYLDHLPLDRQVRICKRHGLTVTSQSLWDQVNGLARELQPAYEALRTHALKHLVIGIDETSWPRLHKGKKRFSPWQMWAVTAPGLVHHSIRDDKSAASMQALVGDFEGYVVCDAASAHTKAERDVPTIKLAFCWAHVVRKLRDVEADFPEVHTARRLIRKLYDIDDEADGDPERRRALRDTRSRQTLRKLKVWLEENIPRYPKTLAIGKALRYPYRHWRELTRFVDEPLIPLDNNATERGLRGPVVGRKTHYGSKSQRGTEVAAIMYSLMETAKLQCVDPAAYLIDAVRAARRGEVLLPGTLRHSPESP